MRLYPGISIFPFSRRINIFYDYLPKEKKKEIKKEPLPTETPLFLIAQPGKTFKRNGASALNLLC